jgi:hypothetical protein
MARLIETALGLPAVGYTIALLDIKGTLSISNTTLSISLF